MNAKIWLAGLCAVGVGVYAAPAPVGPGQHIKLAYDYLEACETGEGECRPIRIRRMNRERVSVSFPPISRASVSLWDSLRYQQFMARPAPKPLERQGSGDDVMNPKPIAFDLTRRPDGTYYLWLTSCGVGGVYEVRLKTH